VATSLLVGARWGSPFLLALLIPAAAFAATGVVSLVASVAHRPESATSIQGVVGTVMGVLGGAFFPVSGGLLGALSLLTPHRWFLDGLTDVAGGGALREVAPEIAVLLAMGLATGALATRRFSVRLGA
jgi:ABC-2 type transport system permease protein